MSDDLPIRPGDLRLKAATEAIRAKLISPDPAGPEDLALVALMAADEALVRQQFEAFRQAQHRRTSLLLIGIAVIAVVAVITALVAASL